MPKTGLNASPAERELNARINVTETTTGSTMLNLIEPQRTRKTSSDVVFEALLDQILTLDIPPGSKMSEVDMAQRFGVSRQPVRDAFTRLSSLGLLSVQPQRATLVRKFPLAEIQSNRFIRLAIELELVSVACGRWSEDYRAEFDACLENQKHAIDDDDPRAFHKLDEAFHGLIADLAGRPEAFELILLKKIHVNRLCHLSLHDPQEMKGLWDDHRQILTNIAAGDRATAERTLRRHLSRMDRTIGKVQAEHGELFEE